MTTSRSGFDVTPLPADRVAALAADFTPEERHVILHQGTERPFCGLLLDNKQSGIYTCRLCGLPLFESDAKFESGTGWPSFFQPFDPRPRRGDRGRQPRNAAGRDPLQRCDAHLGHVFDDGPPPTRLRYCLNSVSLDFVPAGEPTPLRS